jgi:hypothetical protein
MMAVGKRAKGKVPHIDLSQYHTFQMWLSLGPKRVEVPYGMALTTLLPADSIRMRRDADSLFSLIKASALVHQSNRQIESGAIIATLDDYEIAANLIEELIAVETGLQVPEKVRILVEEVEKRIRMKVAEDMVENFNLSVAITPSFTAKNRRILKRVHQIASRAQKYPKDQKWQAAKDRALHRLANTLPVDSFTGVFAPTVIITADDLAKLLRTSDSNVKKICGRAYKGGWLVNDNEKRSSNREFKLLMELPQENGNTLPNRKELQSQMTAEQVTDSVETPIFKKTSTA